MSGRECAICGATSSAATDGGEPIETARVPCNVRAFLGEEFPVWRCPRCRSIHADGQVDLARYYARYPFHGARLDPLLRAFYDHLIQRLRRDGVRPGARVLDYGCGGGLLLGHLLEKGYAGARGYDAYAAAFQDPAPLAETWDCVVCQDVIEHVEDPLALLARLATLLRPGGKLFLGTPNASAIDLARPGDFRHTLHQPYHLHLFAKDALCAAAARAGLRLVRFYKTQYSNLPWPGLNQRFALHYARCFDDTIDLGFDGPRFSPRLLTPRALFWFLFGAFFSVETDVQAVFTTPLALPP